MSTLRLRFRVRRLFRFSEDGLPDVDVEVYDFGFDRHSFFSGSGRPRMR